MMRFLLKVIVFCTIYSLGFYYFEVSSEPKDVGYWLEMYSSLIVVTSNVIEQAKIAAYNNCNPKSTKTQTKEYLLEHGFDFYKEIIVSKNEQRLVFKSKYVSNENPYFSYNTYIIIKISNGTPDQYMAYIYNNKNQMIVLKFNDEPIPIDEIEFAFKVSCAKE